MGKQVRMPSVFAISSLLTPYLVSEIIYFIEGVCNLKHRRKLITFANYSNPSSSFVNIKVSVYTGIIPCFKPPKRNNERNQTFTQYGVYHT